MRKSISNISTPNKLKNTPKQLLELLVSCALRLV